MVCSKCGKELVVETMVCPYCGRRLKYDAKFIVQSLLQIICTISIFILVFSLCLLDCVRDVDLSFSECFTALFAVVVVFILFGEGYKAIRVVVLCALSVLLTWYLSGDLYLYLTNFDYWLILADSLYNISSIVMLASFSAYFSMYLLDIARRYKVMHDTSTIK